MGCINEKYKVNGGFMQARTLAFSYDIAKDATPSRGSKTKYNPNNNENVRGDKREARAGLSHELLGHGWDSDKGKTDYSKTENGIPMYEVNAVNIENRARASAGNEKKTTYGGKPIPANLLHNTHKKK